jgi:hypothetical protein
MWIEGFDNAVYNVNFMADIRNAQDEDGQWAIYATLVNRPEPVQLSVGYDDSDKADELLSDWIEATKNGLPFFSFDVL